jgi:magnesium-transporting ATPase (P-type)
VEQQRNENKQNLEHLGGIEFLAQKLNCNFDTGLSTEQVLMSREIFGNNEFPESPMTGFFELLFGAFCDPVLLVLLAAAGVSLIVGTIEDPDHGYIEGCH